MARHLVRRQGGYSRGYAGAAGYDAGCGVDAFVHGPAVEGAGGPGSNCPVAPPYCGCNVLGGNTLGAAGDNDPIAAQSVGINPIVIDSGDACRWQPRSMLIRAYSALDDAGMALPAGQINCSRPASALLFSAQVGNIFMTRRVASIGQVDFGMIIDGWSDRKELTCVDWSAFTSTNNQQLRLDFYNPCNEPIHVFVDLWGDNLGA